MKLHGACHCGAIAFRLDWPDAPDPLPVRACTCSFCTARGARWTGHASATLTVTLADPALRSRYRFGTETATFHVCARCGGVPVVTGEDAGRRVAVVNANTLHGLDPARLLAQPVSFDGEDAATRVARRARKKALASRNVTINNLLPGPFETDRLRITLEGSAKATGQPLDVITEARRQANPAARFGRPEEFGATAAFLCSAHAGYLNGQNILLDGGAYPGTF